MRINKKFGAILILSVVLLATIGTIMVYSGETKYYFDREECRYIFQQGSCVVDDQHCDLNSHNYVKKLLDPREDCTSEITFNEGFTEEDLGGENRVVVETENGTCAFTIMEEDLIKVSPEAEDPDGDELVWLYYEPLDENGTWQTERGDAGIHDTMITVSDGEFEDTKDFCIEVLSKNKAPVLEALTEITAQEGDEIYIDASCTDEDGDDVEIVFDGWLEGPSKRIDYDDAGKHDVIVTCSDTEGAEDNVTISVTVSDVNRLPTLLVEDVEVNEGELVQLKVEAADIDRDLVTIDYDALLDENGEWQTTEGDAGTYKVVVTASDGKDSVDKTVTIVVNAINTAPSIQLDDEVTVYEGQTVKLVPVTSDEDGDDLIITYEGWMEEATRKTGYEDSGVYDVVIKVTDGREEVSKNVKINVLDKNRPPKITAVKMESPEQKVKNYS